MKRNLIYHVCPLKDNDLWERNVDQLLRRIKIFHSVNIAVALDGRTHDVETVRKKFRGTGDHHFIRVRNDKRLREVATFKPLLDLVRQRRGEATFYAHTKGNSTACSVQGATYWRNMMYHKLLDDYESCVAHLRSGYAAVGCNKIVWQPGQRPPYPTALSHGHWMFAGTFFWFDNDSVFSGKWDDVPSDRYGAEAWLSGMFEPDECKSVFQPWPETRYPSPDPYNPELYRREGVAIEDIELRHPSYSI